MWLIKIKTIEQDDAYKGEDYWAGLSAGILYAGRLYCNP